MPPVHSVLLQMHDRGGEYSPLTYLLMLNQFEGPRNPMVSSLFWDEMDLSTRLPIFCPAVLLLSCSSRVALELHTKSFPRSCKGSAVRLTSSLVSSFLKTFSRTVPAFCTGRSSGVVQQIAPTHDAAKMVNVLLAQNWKRTRMTRPSGQDPPMMPNNGALRPRIRTSF